MPAAHARNGASRAAHIEVALRHLIRATEDFIQGDGSRVEVDLDYCAALADLERAAERAQDVWARHRSGAPQVGAHPQQKGARAPIAPACPHTHVPPNEGRTHA